MAEILHHLGSIKPCKQWGKLPINWCRISAINSSTFSLGELGPGAPTSQSHPEKHATTIAPCGAPGNPPRNRMGPADLKIDIVDVVEYVTFCSIWFSLGSENLMCRYLLNSCLYIPSTYHLHSLYTWFALLNHIRSVPFNMDAKLCKWCVSYHAPPGPVKLQPLLIKGGNRHSLFIFLKASTWAMVPKWKIARRSLSNKETISTV